MDFNDLVIRAGAGGAGDATSTSSGASPTSSNRATPQGGILEGMNPTVYNSKDPITVFIIQAGIIIIFCRLLHYPLSRLRQPRVIAEVVGGILLGPSVMGRIPGFTDAIFPSASIPNLNLVANLGLVLFLFLVGLEVDLRFLISNWRVAASVGVAGMVLPFGLGSAIAWGLYNEFRDEPGTEPIGFGVYMLFIGVAMAITAFPVLCRILTELKLLMTPVGVIVLSAGVGNDVVGWILLALCVALVNSGSGLTALWVLLTCVGYILFLVYAVRPPFIWVLRRSGALQDGPSQGIIALTLLIALASAFFTGVIGVHAIFGAFMAGLICPHEGGFAIKVTEKVEDLVSTLFLPLFFSLSGLNTDLGLLDSGIAWAYVVGVIAVAFFAKFFGAAVAARFNGLVWRESFTIGALMSCKGLVELIVLNIGLQAKILSTRTFTIFVIMALVTTFATTPLTTLLYPPWYQKKLDAWKRGEISWDTNDPTPPREDDSRDSITAEKLESVRVRRLLVYLRLDNMPSLLAFVSILGGSPKANDPKVHPQHRANVEDDANEGTAGALSLQKRPIQAHGLRLIELTERDSSVMKVSEVDEYLIHDPVVNTFRTFAQLNSLAVSGEVAVVPEGSYSDALVSKASQSSSDLILLPWSETGSMSEFQVITNDSVKNKLATAAYTHFVNSTLNNATCSTAVFVNSGFGGASYKEKPRLARTVSGVSLRSNPESYKVSPVTDRGHHIFMPFFGGANDRVALRLVLQMAENPDITATIVHLPPSKDLPEAVEDSPPQDPTSTSESAQEARAGASSTATTTTPQPTTEQDPAKLDTAFFDSIRNSLPAELASRVVFETQHTLNLLSDAMEHAALEVGHSPRNAGDLIVVGRKSLRRAAAQGGLTPPPAPTTEVGSCLGAVAEAVITRKLKASVLVIQAAGKRAE